MEDLDLDVLLHPRTAFRQQEFMNEQMDRLAEQSEWRVSIGDSGNEAELESAIVGIGRTSESQVPDSTASTPEASPLSTSGPDFSKQESSSFDH